MKRRLLGVHRRDALVALASSKAAIERQPRTGRRMPVLGLAVPICLILIFAQQYPSGPLDVSGPYRKVAGPLQIAQILMFGVAALTIIDTFWTRRSIQMPEILRGPAILAFVALLVSFTVGALRGGEDMFFQWRDVLLGLIALAAVGRLCAIYGRRRTVLVGYVVLAGVYATILMVLFLSGGGITTSATGRTPIVDGSTLSVFGFVVCLTTVMDKPSRLLQRNAIRASGLMCALVVIVSLRRTYWVELLIAMSLLLLGSQMKRRRSGLLLAALVGLFLWATTSNASQLIAARLQSFQVFSATGQAAGTNAGHVEDIVLGWQQIKHSPFFGLGIGISYDARQLGWKVNSFGVHNGPLTVWLVFGLLGLVAYLWWFATTIRVVAIRERAARSAGDLHRAAIARAGLVWLVAIFTVSLFFSPWPFGGAQLAIHTGVVLGATLVTERNRTSARPSAGQVTRTGTSRPATQNVPA